MGYPPTIDELRRNIDALKALIDTKQVELHVLEQAYSDARWHRKDLIHFHVKEKSGLEFGDELSPIPEFCTFAGIDAKSEFLDVCISGLDVEADGDITVVIYCAVRGRQLNPIVSIDMAVKMRKAWEAKND